jgi:hypothetical protein
MSLSLPAIIAILIVVVTALALWRFLAAVGKAVEQPITISVKPVSTVEEEADHTPTYFIQNTFNFQQLGFTQFLDFTIPELPHPGIFRALAGYDHSHIVILHEIYPQLEGQKPSRNNKINYMEFQSVLADGTKVNTNNAPLPIPLSVPQGMVVVRKPKQSHGKALFDEHMSVVNNLVAKRGSYLRSQPPGEFAHEFEKDWMNTIEHNIKAGLLRRKDQENTCVGSAGLVIRYFKGLIIG